jgi:hypothetical protein
MPSLRGHEPAIWAAAFVKRLAEYQDAFDAAEFAYKAVIAARGAATECGFAPDNIRHPEALAMLREMLGEGERCEDCDGSGKTGHRAYPDCPTCDGQGVAPGPPDGNWYDCPTCHGTGQPGEKKSQTDGYFDLIRGTGQPGEGDDG